MNLSSEQVSNLTLLADFMEGLVDPRFDMRFVRHGCGAPSCALGWARTIPQFAHSESFFLFCGPKEFESLFGGGLALTIQTPQQWAAHCRAFLKENGYEVKPDPFKTFMDRALAPVEAEIRETS